MPQRRQPLETPPRRPRRVLRQQCRAGWRDRHPSACSARGCAGRRCYPRAARRQPQSAPRPAPSAPRRHPSRSRHSSRCGTRLSLRPIHALTWFGSAKTVELVLRMRRGPVLRPVPLTAFSRSVLQLRFPAPRRPTPSRTSSETARSVAPTVVPVAAVETADQAPPGAALPLVPRVPASSGRGRRSRRRARTIVASPLFSRSSDPPLAPGPRRWSPPRTTAFSARTTADAARTRSWMPRRRCGPSSRAVRRSSRKSRRGTNLNRAVINE
mmetsp:Transcript_161151/g.517277  ORF Transcript_161151/g.517277 Transcript_161151/m.517277 type:complete len:269 (+) Transcript_161151:262-1068(+)